MSENNNPESTNPASEQPAPIIATPVYEQTEVTMGADGEGTTESAGEEAGEAAEAVASASPSVEMLNLELPDLTTRSFVKRMMGNSMVGLMSSSMLEALRSQSPVAARVASRNRVKSVRQAFEEAVETVDKMSYCRGRFKHTMDYMAITNPSGIMDLSEFYDKKGKYQERLMIARAREVGFASIHRAISFTESFSTLEKICDQMSMYDGAGRTFDRRLGMNQIHLKPNARIEIVQAFIDEGWVFVGGDTICKFDEKNRPIGGINFDWHGGSEGGECYSNTPTVWGIGENHMPRLIELFRERLAERTLGTAKLTTIQAINPMSGLETVDDDLSDVRLADSTFFPWMNGTPITEYFMDFLTSDANVLILYGPPGTAKSTMIRTAVKQLGLRALGTSNQKLIGNPQFLTACGSRMSGRGGDAPYDVLIAEDAEILVRSRDLGNPLMSTLLDVTNGMSAKHSFKLILTMNSDNLNDVDTALLRPGRCFDIMHFGYLDAKQAANVRTALKLPEVPIKEGKYVLAEVVNMGIIKTDLIEGKAIVKPRFPLPNDRVIDRSL